MQTNKIKKIIMKTGVLCFSVMLSFCFVIGVSANAETKQGKAEEQLMNANVTLTVEEAEYPVTVINQGNGQYGSYSRSDLGIENITTETNKVYTNARNDIVINVYPEKNYTPHITAVYDKVKITENGENNIHLNNYIGGVTVTISYTYNGTPVTPTPVPTQIPQKYNIKAYVQAGSGKISPSGNIQVGEGENLNITITPDNNYRIDKVIVDGTNIGAVPTYTFKNISDNHSIYVEFISISTPGPAYTPYPTPANSGNHTYNEVNNNPGKNAVSQNVKTGDTFELPVYFTMLCLSVALVFYSTVKRKKCHSNIKNN